MNWEDFTALQRLGIALVGLLVITPIWGYIILKIIDLAERAWKTGDRRKKYLVVCIAFFLLSLRILDQFV